MSFKKKLKELLIGNQSEEDPLLDQVRELVQQNYGRYRIADELGIGENRARRLIEKVKEEPNEETKQAFAEADEVLQSRQDKLITGISPLNKSKRPNTLDEIRGLLDQNFDSYEIAKLKKTTPITTVRMVQKAKDEYHPAEDWVVKAAHKGILLSELQEKFNFKGLKRAKKILEENFENCFVIETPLENDIFLTPVYSSAREVEELRAPGEDKKFKYYVSLEGDYLFIKFDDDIPGDHLEIFCLGDWHIGSGHDRETLMDEYLDRILQKPNAFAFGSGDFIDQATKVSVGDPQEAYLSNTDQIIKAAKKLKPISHKLLDYVNSNHDCGRSDKTSQTRSGQLIANMLGVPYFRQGVTIDIEWRGVRKTIFHAHNFGKAFEESMIVKEINKMKSFMNYEVNAWVMAHIHRATKKYLPHDNKAIGRGISAGGGWLLINGSTSARQLSYGRRAGYGPENQDIVSFIIHEDGRDAGNLIQVACG